MFKGSIFGSSKSSSSSSSSTSKTTTMDVQRNAILEQLISIFPDADQEYLNYCIGFYNDNHVERISEKIFNHNKGHYPKIPKGCSESNSIEAQNYYLLQLNDLFPECDVSFLRDSISSQNNNHVYQITEMLLSMEKSSQQQKSYPKRPQSFIIEDWEFIRTSQYRKAVRYRLYNDFPDIWKSTIKAVLAENNFDYRRSYDKLKDLSCANSYWWNSIFNVFKRKKYADIDDKDLICEIDKLKSLQLDELSRKDHEIAKQINFAEYTNHNQLITCGCCYCDYPFEDLTCCNEGHLFCKECINHLVQEGLYGQGSLRGKVINCIDSSSGNDDIGTATGGGCNGYFTEEKLKSCLNPDLFKCYTESLAEHSLKQANLSLIQCPFCPYCEVDDDDNDPFRQIRISKTFIIISSIPLALLPFFTSFENVIGALNVIAIIVIPQIFLSLLGLFPIKTWIEDFDNIVKRVKRKRRGNIFKCRNPQCNKVSCLLCNRESRPFHKCYEQEQDSLRLYVERAMAEAVKRTCPKCHVSFTKADGCNKMTCRCGYVMCYLCRKDLRQESYAHFCDHFRPIPGQKCKKCNKCDLYKTEDEEKVIKEAAAKARAEYIKSHPEARDVNFLENTAIGPIKNDDEKYIREAIDRAIEKIVDYLLP